MGPAFLRLALASLVTTCMIGAALANSGFAASCRNFQVQTSAASYKGDRYAVLFQAECSDSNGNWFTRQPLNLNYCLADANGQLVVRQG
jgi:hypothetical protein